MILPRRRLLALAFLLALAPGQGGAEEEVAWDELEPGLELAEVASPVLSLFGDSRVTVVRVDPAHYAFTLLSATERGGELRTAPEWARENGLVVTINAGMYQEDGVTSVGYMKNFDHVNNGHLNPNNAVLAFNRANDGVPEVQIIDRTCQDFEDLREHYQTLVQSIRMVSCGQENVWSPSSRSWSMSVVAVDGEGRVLFIFTRSPYTAHDFINVLLGLPLDIYNVMYLEGGPEATLYLAAGGREILRVGAFETGFLESELVPASPLPNVIGVVRRDAGATE